MKINTQELIPILEDNDVKSAGFFGSYIQGKDNPNDVDILVEFNQPLGYFKLLSLQDELSKKNQLTS